MSDNDQAAVFAHQVVMTAPPISDEDKAKLAAATHTISAGPVRVKLPQRYEAYGQGCGYDECANGNLVEVDALIAALKAAGVEVEG